MDLDAVIKQIMPFIQEIMGGTLKTSGSGMIGRMKEIGALGMFLKDAPQKFAGNDLIGGLVQGMLDSDTEGDSYVDVNTLEPSAVLDKLGGLNDILNGLEGDMGAQVKEFIFGLASSIAGASGTGLFGSGQKVSAEEESFLNGLKDKLGL
jgi:hypothetical protein